MKILVVNFFHQSRTVLEPDLVSSSHLRGGGIAHAVEYLVKHIDLLAVSAKKDKYLVGECKFKGKPFSFGEYLDTAAKLSQQKEKSDFYYMLFSESGFDEKLSAEPEKGNNIKLIGIEKIVADS